MKKLFLISIFYCLYGCATSPNMPDVRVVSGYLADEEYAYKIKIPDSWDIVNDAYLNDMPYIVRSQFSSIASNFKDSGFKALLLHPTGKGLIIINRSYFVGDESLEVYMQEAKSYMKQKIIDMNRSKGSNFYKNLKINYYENIADFNATYEASNKYKYIIFHDYYYLDNKPAYIELICGAYKHLFETMLPIFQDCARSIQFEPYRANNRNHLKSEKDKKHNEKFSFDGVWQGMIASNKDKIKGGNCINNSIELEIESHVVIGKINTSKKQEYEFHGEIDVNGYIDKIYAGSDNNLLMMSGKVNEYK